MNWLHWSLLSALFAALTAVLAKAGVAGVDSHLATALRTTVILVASWLIYAAFGERTEWATVSKRTWALLFFSGLASAASWLCYFRALKSGAVSQVAPIDKLSVVLVLVFSATWLGEALDWRKVAGALLISLGAVLLASG